MSDIFMYEVKAETLFGMEHCKSNDWTYVQDFIYMNSTGDTVEFRLHKESEKFVEYWSEVTPKGKGGHISSLLFMLDDMGITLIPQDDFNLLADMSRAYENMMPLGMGYRGFEYITVAMETLEAELPEVVEACLDICDYDLETFISIIEFNYDKDTLTNVLSASFPYIPQLSEIEDFAEIEDLINQRQEA